MSHSSEVSAVLVAVRESPKGGDVSGVLREWAVAGQVEWLVELFEALGRQVPDGDLHRIRIARAARSVEEALAQTPGLACVRTLLHVVKLPRPRMLGREIPVEERLRELASLLGVAQTQETLLRVLNAAGTNAAERELLACWMQECTLRGGSLAEEERARHFHAALRIRGHPLAVLPLTLDGLESELSAYLRDSRRRSASRQVAESGPRSSPPPGEEPSGESVPHEVDDEALSERMRAAVEGWLEAGNCNLEARVFRLEPPVASGEQAVGLLPRLGLEALTEVDAEPPTPRRLGPEEVLRVLFVAAAKGGALGSARQGAYGRLSAWRSLAALAGAGETESMAAVAAVARGCTFWDFSLSTSWFYAVAWDVGLAVLRPDGASLAVLAATDTG
jgi:hypothetical protein